MQCLLAKPSKDAFENIHNSQPDGRNTHKVDLNVGGLLNTVTNQVMSVTNPSNYSLNIESTTSVPFRPTSKPHVSSGPLETGGT